MSEKMNEKKSVNFTAKQRQAIEYLGSDTLVSAAAGSGKTAVLTERVAQLIKNGTPIEKMLIVTYTNAAAAEMRARISKRLDAEGMAEQARSVSAANISTLHSFCTLILREFFVEAGISPSFRVQEEGRGHRMKQSAFSKALEEMLENKDFYDTIRCFGGTDRVKAYAMKLYDFMNSRPDPHEWLTNMLNDFRRNAADIEHSSWALDACENAERACIKAASLIEECFIIVDNPRLEATLHADAEIVLMVLDAARQGYKILSFYKPSFSIWPRGVRDDTIRAQREIYKKIINEVVSLPTPLNDGKNEAAMLPHLKGIGELVMGYSRIFAEMKAEAGELDFSDLEHFALKVLRKPEISEIMRKRYDHVFIDEYQDANALQEEILKNVTRGGNLFMVGDVKQSIYGFRMAEPSLFAGKFARFAKNDGGRLITMNDNFRSHPAVIDCVNEVFSKTMTKKLAGVEYDEDAWMIAGRKDNDPQPLKRAKLQVLVMEETKDFLQNPENFEDDSGDDEGEEYQEFLDDFSSMTAEIQLIINNIMSLVGKEMPINGLIRQIEYKDICVLFRAPKRRSATISDMFRRAGIPYVSDFSEGYFGRTEVKALVDLLSVIDNRHQDEPLIGAMLCPFGGFSPSELAHIRRAYPGEKREKIPFHFACMNYAAEIDDSLGKRLADFFDRLKNWRQMGRDISPADLIILVLEETGYYDFVGGLNHGQFRQENLRMLIARAREYDTLSEFVTMAALGDEDSGEAISLSALSEDENAVRIMSMHKSKGLEFPVVIVAGTGGRMNFKDAQHPLIFHREKGFGVSYLNPDLLLTQKTMSSSSIAWAIKRDVLAEEMRTLYVAMTRARELLIVTGTVPRREASEKKWSGMAEIGDYSDATTMLDFIAPSFDGDEKYVELSLGGGKTGAAIFGQDDEEEKVPGWIKERLEWEYEHTKAARPEKMNVTALLREEAQMPPPRPEFLQEKGGLSGAERGTAMHTVLSALDKKRLKGKDPAEMQAEIAAQMKNMLKMGLISKAQAKAVQGSSLAAFFCCDLGRRALDSVEILCEQPFNLVVTPEEIGEEVSRENSAPDKIFLQGIIDLCFEEGGEWVVVDFKSGKMADETAKAVYGRQIRLYGRAMERLTGKKAVGYLYMLDTGSIIRMQ